MSKIYSRPRIRIPKALFRNKENKNFKTTIIIKTIMIITIGIFTCVFILDEISPIFSTLCKDKAKSISTLIINEQTSNVMKEHNYEELYSVEKDNNGKITMIKANIYPLNEIITDIAIRIQKEINNKGKEDIGIALGSFTGVKLISGRGPTVPIKISTIGNVETDLKSEFVSQGINQTIHRVYLKVMCEVSILTPYNNITDKITNQVLLTEHLIIGNIPETYYDIEGIEEQDAIEFLQ